MHPYGEAETRRDQYEPGSWNNPAENSLFTRAVAKGPKEVARMRQWKREHEKDIEERLAWLESEFVEGRHEERYG